jgi:putative membrane protein
MARERREDMDLVVGTLALRPYVFGFLLAFLVAALRDLGWRRTLLFGAAMWPTAWLAEFTSTRVGIPFGLYHYTGSTRGQELFIANVPFFDSLSFVFLAYAAFCLARFAGAGGNGGRWRLVLATGALMTVLDVVIDPLAVRGDRWFLGRIFYYAEAGEYFGVPLSNFAGWMVVGVIGVGLFALVTGPLPEGRVRPGVALYYAVLAFNLGVTAWIGEWALAAVGLALHATVGLGLAARWPRRRARAGLERKELQEV